METLKGKNVLVVGATGGIGSGTVRLLTASGASVFLAGRNPRKLAFLAEELKLQPGQYLQTDITKPDQVEELKQRFFSRHSTLDILLNASGAGIIKNIDELTPEEFRLILDCNLYGPFLLLKAFLPKMKELKKGLIINIPGILGKVPMAGAAAYSASKYGLIGMMQSVREEIKRTEIRITNVFLGGVDTAFWDEIDLKVNRDKMVRADDAARAIWFLCQQPSSAVVSEMVLQPFNHQAL